MKKILFVLILLLIFSINVIAIDIDIGAEAIDRPSYFDGPRTVVNYKNPANETGKITSIEIFAVSGYPLVNCEIASFFVVSGNYLSTRNTYFIGDVPAGSKQTIGVDLDIQEGDFIGAYFSSGRVETTVSGGSGGWYSGGDLIPCTNALFSWNAGYEYSLYGTGTTAVGWDHKWNTKTISKWNTKEFTKWNGLE